MLSTGFFVALALALPPYAQHVHLTDIALPGIGPVQVSLERFETLTADARAEHGAAAPTARAESAAPPSSSAEALLAAARAVSTYGGEVEGYPGSRAYMAYSPSGRVGLIEVDGRRFALAPESGSWHGPVSGPARWVESPGAGAPAIDDMCRVLGGHQDEGGAAGLPVPAPSARGLRVRVAADCDYEFTSIFADEESAAAYVVSLYGAISEIYRHECGVRVQLSYIRLWSTPDDPYQNPDPLVQFRDLWNAEQSGVVRDVAQLLTGRRDLPYGGVAWLSSACGSNAYSVCGYLIGSFADAGRTDPGNWDIIVTAHELGHNIGTLHTHDYGIDTCASGTTTRGGFMSYCHTVSGATANVDLTMHTIVRDRVAEFLVQAPCITADCDGDGVDDGEAIARGDAMDSNADGIPDHCQDCDGDATPDPVEIVLGAADLDGNGIPDACEPDCNGNGVVDAHDIAQHTSQDAWGNGIPDECERDCNGNGISDYSEIQSNMSLDLDRNAELDACQDCDGDGTLDATVLAGARHWWVSTNDNGSLSELNGRSGVRQRTAGAAANAVTELALGDDGLIYGTSGSTVVRWNPATGALLGAFVPSGLGGLSQARGLIFMPDGTLLVASRGSAQVLRYSDTGGFLGVFATLPGLPAAQPHGLALRGDGAVAVSANDGRVHGYAADGSPLGVLADLSPLSAASNPSGVLYLPSGALLVASRGMNEVHKFDGATGAHLGRFDVSPNAGSSIALKTPMSMKLVADGKIVLVTSQSGTTAIIGFNAESGYHTRTYRVYSVDAPSATGLLVMPGSPLDCNGNFVPDSCDVASGASEDRNADGKPDECQGGPWAAADLNFDGAVNGADLGIMLGVWGPCKQCVADLDGDGSVGGSDLGALLASWSN